MKHIPLSVLELAIRTEGGDATKAIADSTATAQHAESLGYKRLWLAEHHNMPHVFSSATSVLIGHIASRTSRIRIGSGGIMLPNHSPLVIAEQFGTLETLYPGRIDLGLGRAPGTDQLTAMALRRNNMHTVHSFPADVQALQNYFSAANSSAQVRAFPGEGLPIPLWILGSSTDSAYLAAELGLPYAFAAHFAPAQLLAAIAIYKKNFRPSAQLQQPYLMVAVNVIAADTDEQAAFLSSSLIRLYLGILTDQRQPLAPPGLLPDSYLQRPEVRQAVDNMMQGAFAGSMETIRKNLSVFIADTGLDELMVAGHIYELDAKLKSFSLLKEALHG